MHVHGLTLDRGGCFHYRIRQPLTALRARGHWTSWGSGVDFETWDRATVLVNQYLHTEQTAEDWTRWAKEREKLCVWEADDDIFTVHTNEAAGSAYRIPETVPRMRRMLEASHLVTTTTPALAEVYRRYNPNVTVLRNSVPRWLVDEPMHETGGPGFVIGYTASVSHYDDFYRWSEIYDKWMRRNSNITTLKLIGPDKRPRAPLSYRIITVPWKKATDDYLKALPGSMDVGIAPLEDNEFNRGKSGIKAQEYAAAGIPCIAADMPQYRDVIVHGVTGFLVRTHREWLDALGTLAHDRELRERMGRAAKEHARANFVQEDTVAQWETAYEVAAAENGVQL